MHHTNKQAVLELLDVSKVDSIYDVIGRMELLIKYCESKNNLHNVVPFLKTYYFVTKHVARKNLERKYIYKDFHELEKIDIVFAGLFFRPLAQYIDTGKKVEPWNSYFGYIENDHGISFLKMLLGINAHINADLPVVLDTVQAKQFSDFDFINQVLLEVIPEVMQSLAFSEHDVLGLGALLFKDFVQQEFQQIIVRWRSIAWQNYQTIQTYKRKNQAHKKLHDNSREVAYELERLFSPTQLIDLPNFLSGIHSLENKLLLN